MDVVVAVVAVLAATLVVLRDVTAYDRPAPAPKPAKAVRAEPPAPKPVHEPALVSLDVLPLAHDDEHRAGRRATAALLLLTLTLLAAGLVGAGIYRAVVALR